MKKPLLSLCLLCGLYAPLANGQAVGVTKPIYGVTLDDLSRMNAILDSLKKLPYKPTVRIVFDPDMTAAEYLPLVTKVHCPGSTPLRQILG
jgi:hypothetical protein